MMSVSLSRLDDLVYELLLATARPHRKEQRDMTRSSAALDALSSYMANLLPSQLKELKYIIHSLLYLLDLATKTTFDSIEPCSLTAASCICNILPSRVCMNQFILENGLNIIHEIFDDLFHKKDLILSEYSSVISLIEYCSIIIREVSRYYSTQVVESGLLVFIVKSLRSGTISLKTISAGIMATLSTHQTICEHIFSHGAVKPLLIACNSSTTNEACMLACIGCITQMCRIPEIATVIVKQGALDVLLSALALKGTYSNDAIHEKAIFGLSCISAVPELNQKLISSQNILNLFRIELKEGTEHAKYTVVHILLICHGNYNEEADFIENVYNLIADLFTCGSWRSKSICLKAIAVLYKRNLDVLYDFVVNRNAVEIIFECMRNKNDELQEVFVVALLTFCVHPELPWVLITKGAVPIVANLLRCKDDIIKDLAIVFLKGIALYNRPLVEQTVDDEFLYLFSSFLLDSYDEIDHKYTTGHMIDEFLLIMVENRRDQKYLRSNFSDFDDVVSKLGVTNESLESYENIFYELDCECRGALGLIELKMLAVMLGERFDEEELEELLAKHDTDKSGALDFMEFIVMMQSWFEESEQSNIVEQAAYDATQRGPIAKARRAFLRWWKQDDTDKKNIDELKRKNEEKRMEAKRLAEEFLSDRKLIKERNISTAGSKVSRPTSRESVRDLAKKKRQ